MNELLDKIERIDQGVDRLIQDRKLLLDALLVAEESLSNSVRAKEGGIARQVNLHHVRAALKQVGRP